MHRPATIYRCSAICDRDTPPDGPAEIVVVDGLIAAAGPEASRQAVFTEEPRWIDLGDTLVMPAMVNAHAHLQLTTLGPTPYDGGPAEFVSWVTQVMQRAPQDGPAITDAVVRGVRASHEAGVGWLADIGGLHASQQRIRQPLPGVGLLECFGIGLAQDLAIDLMADQWRSLEMVAGESGRAVPGIQPHAPYSAGIEVYRAAKRLAAGGQLATHLAETPGEIAFVRDGTGPFVDLLKSIGKWDDSIRGSDMHPVDALADLFDVRPDANSNGGATHWLLAHCNYVDDDHIAMLAGRHVTVAYCPVASDYFGHEGHRYRDMIGTGVNVALGTDSILCQPPDAMQPMSIVDQMRHLYARDRTDPHMLLRMALGGTQWSIAEPTPSLCKGAPAQLCGVRFDSADDTPPLTQVMTSRYPVIAIGN